VAIKIITKASLDEQTLVMVNREIRIMKLLHHPHIIRLFDVKEDPMYLYLIMEYATGGEVDVLLAEILN
jgi:serine/threonine protein kinase